MNVSGISLAPYMSLDIYENVTEHKPTGDDEQRNRPSISSDGEGGVSEGFHVDDAVNERHKDTGVVSATRDHDAGRPPQPSSSKAAPTNTAAAGKPTRHLRRLLLSLALSVLLLFAVLFISVVGHRSTGDSSDVAVSGYPMDTPGVVFEPRASRVDTSVDTTSTEAGGLFVEPAESSESDGPATPAHLASESATESVQPAKPVAAPIHRPFTDICLYMNMGTSRSAARMNQVKQAGRGCQLLLHCCADFGRDFKINFDDDSLEDEKFLLDFKADKESPPAIALLLIRTGRDPFLNHATAVQFAWTVAEWCVENKYDRVYLSSRRQDDISLELIGYVRNRLSAFNVSFGLALAEDRPDVQSMFLLLGTDAVLVFQPGYGNLVDSMRVVSDAMYITPGAEELCHVPRLRSDDAGANSILVENANETFRGKFPNHRRVRGRHSEKMRSCRGLRFI